MRALLAALLVVAFARASVARAQDSAAEVVVPPPPRLSSAPLPPMPPMDLPDLGGGRPLTLEDVLRSVEAHHPPLDAARARVRAAEGAQLSAEGAFDPGISATGFVAPLGYYEYVRAQAQVTQYTGLWGSSAFAGYRLGRGLGRGGIPGYYGFYETLDGGELYAGITVPLWRDGPIDPRRAQITRSELGVEAAEGELAARGLQVRLAATDAYWRWWAAGRKARVAQDLLRLAEERDRQIGSRVAAGAIPAIEHLENRRAILERRQAMVVALRAVERGAIQLSLYYRDRDGAPRIADVTRLPGELGAPPRFDRSEAEAIASALEARPELARFRALREAATVSVELADNQIAPRIDLTLLAASDIGGDQDSERFRRLSPAVLEGMLQFSLPLGMREARGRADTARAELRAIDAEAELASDRIRMEVQDALSALRAAEQAVALAEQSAEVAEQVARGERTRFENGATTLLIVNLREAAAASALASLADARADLQIARAWVDVALGATQ